MLHGEFAGRIRAGDVRPIDVERFCQHRIFLAPLVENDLRDIQFVPVPEDAGIGPVLHQRQSVAHQQFVRRQAAIALARRRLCHDAADGAHIAAIRHELEFDGQCDEFLEGQAGMRRYAQEPVFEAATHRFIAGDTLDQQDIVEHVPLLRQS